MRNIYTSIFFLPLLAEFFISGIFFLCVLTKKIRKGINFDKPILSDTASANFPFAAKLRNVVARQINLCARLGRSYIAYAVELDVVGHGYTTRKITFLKSL